MVTSGAATIVVAGVILDVSVWRRLLVLVSESLDESYAPPRREAMAVSKNRRHNRR